MDEFWVIIASVLGVFLVMVVGAFCRYVRWLTTEADRTLANLTANVMLPAYFVNKFTTDSEIASIGSAWQPPLVGCLSTAAGFLIAFLVARKIGPWIGLQSDASQRAFGLCAGICNYGYFPLPLAERFYPSAVIELILHNVGVEIALWSLGIAIISGGGADGWKKPLKSPPLWAVAFSILLNQLGLAERIPDAVRWPIGALAGCAIPLGLLLSGAIIVDFLRDRSWLSQPRLILAAIGVRQLLIPLLMLSIGGWLIRQPDLRTVIMLQASMPAAVFPIVLTKLYGRDTDTALRVVLWTSLVGVVLIPAWLAAGAWWMGNAAAM
jgi:predicted permease